MTLRRALAGICLAAGLAAPTAAAQSGVVIDEDSPTAKEYAIPLAKAREQANPRRDNRPASPAPAEGESETLFGAGVGDDDAGAGGAAGGKKGGRGGGSSGGNGGDGGGGEAMSGGGIDSMSEDAARALDRADSQPGAPEGNDTVLFLTGALLLVAVGVGAGMLVRRRTTATG